MRRAVEREVRSLDGLSCVFCGVKPRRPVFVYLDERNKEFVSSGVVIGCQKCSGKPTKDEARFGRFASKD